MTIICLSFLILGVFLALSNNLSHTARRLAADMTVAFFLSPDLPERDIRELEAEARRHARVQSVEFVGRDQALVRFRKSFPELGDVLDGLKSNPFPPSLEVRLKAGVDAGSQEVLDLIAALRGRKGVEDVQYNQDLVEKMRSLGRLAGAAGFFLGGILILASVFIISNVIKLNVLARKDEIEILRLSGASNGFIRIPFLLEGVTLGILGSLLSLALLAAVVALFPLYVGPSLGALREILSFRYLTGTQAGLLVAAGAGLGLLGSATSMSRFLRI